MIYVNGFVHCDPHPGNILVSKSKNDEVKITMLDHGLYQVRIANHLNLILFRLVLWNGMLAIIGK